MIAGTLHYIPLGLSEILTLQAKVGEQCKYHRAEIHYDHSFQSSWRRTRRRLKAWRQDVCLPAGPLSSAPYYVTFHRRHHSMAISIMPSGREPTIDGHVYCAYHLTFYIRFRNKG